jgi:hypothetical protein
MVSTEQAAPPFLVIATHHATHTHAHTHTRAHTHTHAVFASLDAIVGFFRQAGVALNAVRLRRHARSRAFKGSAFLECSDADEAARVRGAGCAGGGGGDAPWCLQALSGVARTAPASAATWTHAHTHASARATHFARLPPTRDAPTPPRARPPPPPHTHTPPPHPQVAGLSLAYEGAPLRCERKRTYLGRRMAERKRRRAAGLLPADEVRGCWWRVGCARTAA